MAFNAHIQWTYSFIQEDYYVSTLNQALLQALGYGGIKTF